MAKVLYISYDGLTDSLGQSQILPYLVELEKEGHSITIISFEKKVNYNRNIDIVLAILRKTNIKWARKWYTKRPPILSTLIDVLRCYLEARKVYKMEPYSIIHCRGYISSLVGYNLKNRANIKFIFDMRGWWPDEKLESGSWNNLIFKPVYSYFKKIELKLFAHADFVVSLTNRGKNMITDLLPEAKNRVGVVPTCVNLDLFPPARDDVRMEIRGKLKIPSDVRIFVYSGSLGGNYCPHILANAFIAFEKNNRNAHLLILSKDALDNNIQDYFKSMGIDSVTIVNAKFNEVSDYLRSADVGFIFYKNGFSLIGRCPTKLGEYWASGLPVISFSGVGDLDALFVKYARSGVLLSSDMDNWSTEMSNIYFADSETLRYYANDYFSLEKGVGFYDSLYNSL